MSVIQALQPLLPEVAAWRQQLHRRPELGFAERETCAFIAQRLREFGLTPELGLADTGVVASLRKGSGNRMIALRADIDALPITEATGLDYASENPGVMHACGHDGHTAMLLGAAKALSAADGPAFDGTVLFVFQPAEEGGGGGRIMVEQGLFERFDADEVYGLHNCPGLPLGQMALRPGPIMASADEFEIEIFGRGGHAAMPHTTADPVPVAMQIVAAVQSLTAREIDPLDSLVISLTQIAADGGSPNIIPARVRLAGTIRALRDATRSKAIARLRELAQGIASSFGQRAEVTIHEGYPVTRNSPAETEAALLAAQSLLGAEAVDGSCAPMMAAEDFAYMLNVRPGAYLFLGNGAPGEKGSANLHSDSYDFNDAASAYGIGFWLTLVGQRLAADCPGSIRK